MTQHGRCIDTEERVVRPSIFLEALLMLCELRSAEPSLAMVEYVHLTGDRWRGLELFAGTPGHGSLDGSVCWPQGP